VFQFDQIADKCGGASGEVLGEAGALKSFCSEVYRGCFPPVALDLELNVLAFIERAQAGPLHSRDVDELVSAID
jgi:hypothetical protein